MNNDTMVKDSLIRLANAGPKGQDYLAYFECVRTVMELYDRYINESEDKDLFDQLATQIVACVEVYLNYF